MKQKVSNSVNKVKNALVDNEYQTARELADKCGMQPCSVYHVIRNMRVAGIGIMSTNKGYVLSEFAKKTDDVNFIRRLYGRRASDFIAISAAQRDIQKRWNTIEEKREFKLLVEPLTVDISNSKGMRILLDKSTNSKGI
jgi:biotin operon repressor